MWRWKELQCSISSSVNLIAREGVRNIERKQVVQCKILTCIEVNNIAQYQLETPIKFQKRQAKDPIQDQWYNSRPVSKIQCQDSTQRSRTGLDCGKTPDPYAKAYLIGARNCHKICRKASLNSSLITICWFTPKFECGSSEK